MTNYIIKNYKNIVVNKKRMNKIENVNHLVQIKLVYIVVMNILLIVIKLK